MKRYRYNKIKEIVQSRSIETQEELANALMEEGIEVTQATVSRDIKELMLIKIPTGDGHYRYALSPEENVLLSRSRINRLFQDSITRVDFALNQVVLHTLPGSAQAVAFAIDHFRYFAGVIRAEEGSATMLDNNTLSLILNEPIGVVGQVIPWNFPFLMAAWKLAPALAAGCTIVIKPSSHTSLSLLEFGDILKSILPAGVVNIITGKGSKSGQYILDHPGFAKLAFTGSTEVGLDVYKAASQRLIPATLELGGKSANIFFEDAKWDMAMDGAMLGILFNQGQVCCAGSRIFVQDTIYDKFVTSLAKHFEKVKVGLPWKDDTQMGSQIYAGQVKKILEYVDIAKKEGARVLTGGVQATDGELAKGNFVKPTLIVDVTNDMRVAQEEIFGPVAVVIKFHDEADVIKMANDSVYGLGGGVWTRDINRAVRVAEAIETGRMWVNCYNSIPAGAPFGGYKQSGIGRETHKIMLEHYSQKKNIIINLSEKPSGFYDVTE